MRKNLNNLRRYISIGLMSGTSQDGIDVGIIETDGKKIYEIGPSLFYPYQESFRKDLKRLIDVSIKAGKPTKDKTVGLQLSKLHIIAMQNLISSIGIDNKFKYPDIIGFHGHTVIHSPNEGFTQQIGDSSLISKKMNLPVVGDFRANDIVNGGEGAPLTPIFHKAIFNNISYPVAVINIGGIANITWINNLEENIIAFDLGPGNCLLDEWISIYTNEYYDRNGEISSTGKINEKWLTKAFNDKFFLQSYPKSLDRGYFSFNGLSDLNLEDGAATLASFTAKSIIYGVNQCPSAPRYIYLSGGGRKNKTIISILKQNLSSKIMMIDELNFDGDMLEANAFAYLAVRSLKKYPLTFPNTTGVNEPTLGGKIFYNS